MKKYRVKERVFEAVQFAPSGENWEELSRIPRVAADYDGNLVLLTRDGWVTVYPGEWLVRASEWEWEAWTADDFEADFEEAGEEAL